MNREDSRKYFDILELPIEADLSEVKKAYLMLKEIYTTDSIVTMSMMDEASTEQKEDILREIEEAYHLLSALFTEEQREVVSYIDEMVADISDFHGETLRTIRRKLNISLDDVAMATRIPQSHLVNIEADNFSELPVSVYTRGFVMNYAKFLSLDPEVVVKSYMEKFRLWHAARGG